MSKIQLADEQEHKTFDRQKHSHTKSANLPVTWSQSFYGSDSQFCIRNPF